MKKPTKLSVTTRGSLHAVPSPEPTLGDKFDTAVENRGGDPRKVRRAGKYALLLAAGATVAGLIGAKMGPEAPRDDRTEINQQAERDVLAPLFDAEKPAAFPYSAEIGGEKVIVSQFKGSAVITLDKRGNNPHGINLRETPIMQRDLSNGKYEESNATIRVGNPLEENETIRNADTVTLVDPLVVAYEDGTQFYGGVVTMPGEQVPLADATADDEAFSDSVSWVNVSGLSEPYSGADVTVTSGDAGRSVQLHQPDPSIEGGPYYLDGNRLPVAYLN
ncbi:hypothetical protein E6P97_02940 [Patescibacteria group bacterium]|nr:MAG: hypothetical protein E6P97_02940 [Patescibacteria group bacterium]